MHNPGIPTRARARLTGRTKNEATLYDSKSGRQSANKRWAAEDTDAQEDGEDLEENLNPVEARINRKKDVRANHNYGTEENLTNAVRRYPRCKGS